MNCERCGTGLPDSAVICPSCGTITGAARPAPQPPTDYGSGPYSPPGYGNPPPMGAYGQGYAPPQPNYMPPPQPGYMPPPQPNVGYGYGYAPQAPMYQPAAVNVVVTNTSAPSSNKNTGALITEILLSLFLGVYGVGWLMAGETTAGVVLLICSILFYWPIFAAITIFTLGLGDLCLVPLAIGGLILNAVLLNKALERKATQFIMVQTNQMPPQYPPYRQ